MGGGEVVSWLKESVFGMLLGRKARSVVTRGVLLIEIERDLKTEVAFLGYKGDRSRAVYVGVVDRTRSLGTREARRQLFAFWQEWDRSAPVQGKI